MSFFNFRFLLSAFILIGFSIAKGQIQPPDLYDSIWQKACKDLNESLIDCDETCRAYKQLLGVTECPTQVILECRFQNIVVSHETKEGLCDGQVDISFQSEEDYFFVYSNGESGINLKSLQNLCPGDYTVTAYNLAYYNLAQSGSLNVEDTLNTCQVLSATFTINNGPPDVQAFYYPCWSNLRVYVKSASCPTESDGEIRIFYGSGGSTYGHRVLWSDGSTDETRLVSPGEYTGQITYMDESTTPNTLRTYSFSVWVSSGYDCENPVDPDDVVPLLNDAIKGLGINGEIDPATVERITDEIEGITGPIDPNSDAASMLCVQEIDARIRHPFSPTDFGDAYIDCTTENPPISYVWADDPTVPDGDRSIPMGSYKLTMYDSELCYGKFDFQLVPVCVAPCDTIQVDVSTTIGPCTGQEVCDGTATLHASGGSGVYFYEWSDGQTGNVAVGLCAGTTYKVIIRDAVNDSCETTYSVTMPNCTDPCDGRSISATQISDESYVGMCDASARVDVSPSPQNYVFNWFGPGYTSNDQVATDLCGGNRYYVVLTDTVNGCVDTASVFISGCEGDDIVTDVDVVCTTQLGPNNCNGSINVSTGNSSGYTFTWTDYSFGSFPPNFPVTVTNNGFRSGLCSGIYSVRVVDDQTGCDTLITFVVCYDDTCIQAPVEVDVFEDPSKPGMCNGKFRASPSGSPSNYNIEWNVASTGGGTRTETGRDLENVCPRDFITLIVTDINTGCSFDSSFFADHCAFASVSIEYLKQPACEDSCNGEVRAIPEYMDWPIIYSWTINGDPATVDNRRFYEIEEQPPILDPFGPINPFPIIRRIAGPSNELINLCPGDTVVVTATDSSGCVASDTLIIEPRKTSCCEGNLSYEYNLDYLGCGCSGYLDLVVTGVAPPYNVVLGNQQKQGGNGQTISFFDLCPGEQVFEIFDNTGCSVRDTLYLEELASCCDTLSLSHDSLGYCINADNFRIPNNEGVFVVVSGANGISWSPNYGIEQSPFAPNFYRLFPGQNTTYVVMTENPHCPAGSKVQYDTVHVDVTPVPNVRLEPGNTVVCSKPETVLYTGEVLNMHEYDARDVTLTYLWNEFEPNRTKNEVYSAPEASTTNVYMVDEELRGEFRVFYGPGCSKTTPFRIELSNYFDSIIDFPSEVYVCPEVGSYVLPSQQGFDFCWKLQGTIDCLEANGSGEISVPSDGKTYIAEITAPDGCSQSRTLTVNEHVVQPPSVNFEGGSCEDPIIQMVASGGQSYTWITNYNLSCYGCSDPIIIDEYRSGEKVILQSLDLNGCMSSVNVNIPTNFGAGNYPSPSDLALENLDFSYYIEDCTVYFEANYSGFEEYTWDFGDGSYTIQSGFQEDYDYQNSGKYLVRLSVKSKCSESTVYKYVDLELDNCNCTN